MMNHEVLGFGTYQYDQDLYDQAMVQTVAQLRERVQGGCEGMEAGTRTKVNKLRKADLAAMVAEWDTAVRENEGLAAKQAIKMQRDVAHAQGVVDAAAAEDDVASEKVYAEFAAQIDKVVANLTGMGQAAQRVAEAVQPVVETIKENDRASARQLAMQAFANEPVTVRSMGQQVPGKVVDAVLRTPDRNGRGRVLLVVEHANSATKTRTLHRLHDVAYAS